MGLVHLDAQSTSPDAALRILDRDAALVLDALMPDAVADAILSELAPFIAGTVPFDDDFVGRQTTRTGALVARSPSARTAITDERVLPLVNEYLGRHSKNYQLSLTQIMRLLPGQPAQALHRDRYLWSRSLTREVEPMVSCIWALTDFTEENGATRLIPQSHLWSWDLEGKFEESIPAEMNRGSVLIYSGSIIHGGGANHSEEPRIGMNVQYLLAWLRQEENQYLSCPPQVARDLDPALQALLGYTSGNNSLGYFSTLEPSAAAIDTLPPEAAVGGIASVAPQQPF